MLRNAPERSGRIWGPKSAELQAELAIGTLRNAPERSGTLRNAPAGFGAPNRPNCKPNWRSERSGTLWNARPDLEPQIGRPAGPAASRPEIGPPNRPKCKRNWRPERSGAFQSALERSGTLRLDLEPQID